MISNKIGYMICESCSEPREATVVGEVNGKLEIEAILQDCEVKNRNGRFYAKKDLEPELTCARTIELIKSGNFVGECGHPSEQSLARQQTIDPKVVSHKITKLWMEGNDIKGIVRGTPNRYGEEFDNFIRDDTKVSFSLRALGSINNTNRGAEVKNVKIITWDWVVYPSHKRAYMQGIVSESGELLSSTNESSNRLILPTGDKGIITPITNQSVINYIKTESANIKTVMESFDLLYSSIVPVNEGRDVQMCDKDGNVLVIRLENYIQNEIRNFCYNRY